MKKLNFAIFLYYLFTSFLYAEVIDNITKEEKKFGDWTVLCEKDVMMEDANCKIFTTFYNNTSSV